MKRENRRRSGKIGKTGQAEEKQTLLLIELIVVIVLVASLYHIFFGEKQVGYENFEDELEERSMEALPKNVILEKEGAGKESGGERDGEEDGNLL